MANTKKKEVVLNLDNFGVPIAIILSGLVIAALVFFSSRATGSTDTEATAGESTSQSSESSSSDSSNTVSVTLGDDPYLGDKETATVAIIDFSDYQCGYCQRHAEETFPDLKENYIDTGKILYVFKEYPLGGAGYIGYETAVGASCLFSLSDSETYLEYHKSAFFLDDESEITALAIELGIDEEEFTACMSSNEYADEIEDDASEGASAGISGTPGFIVGLIGEDGVVEGTLIAGAYPYDTFVSAIEALLEE